MPILKIALENYKAEIMKQLEITDEKLLDNESMFKTKNENNITADYLRHRLHYVLKNMVLKNKKQQENISTKIENQNTNIISTTNAVKKYKLKRRTIKKLAV